MARQPRPCVCDLQLERCDASCNRKMLETTFYMAALHLGSRPCLVVGAGPVALEKIEGLLVCDAKITVVAPEAVAEVADLAREGAITWHQRVYEPADLEGRFMVIAATSDTDLNVGVFRDAEARQMLVNVVDVPPLCNFILPAIVRSGPIAIAISTSGASPALAKRLKREIAEQFGDSARAPRRDAQRAARLGQGHVRHVRGAQGLLRGHRERLARPDRAAARG